jgi:hypothetical protein
MKQYLLSVHYVDGDPPRSEDDTQRAFRDVAALNDELVSHGVWVFGGGLHTPDISTVVRRQGDETLVTDGPFAEAREHIGGFWVIKAPDLDVALEWAKKATVACAQPVEVRPFQEETDD